MLNRELKLTPNVIRAGFNRELNSIPSSWPELVVHMGPLVVHR